MKTLMLGAMLLFPFSFIKPTLATNETTPPISSEEACACGMTNQEVAQLFNETMVIDGNVTLAVHNNSINASGDIGYVNMSMAQRASSAMTRVGLNSVSITSSSSFEDMISRANQINNTNNTVLVRNSYDFEKAKRENKLSVMIYSQKHYPLNNNVNRITDFYNRGLRVFQITYGGSDIPNVDDKERLGAGGLDATQWYRDRYGVPYSNYRLTTLGRKAVQKCNQLNMIIDVSHCHEATIQDVISLSSAPVIANHANCEHLNNSGRNLSDNIIRAIARTGGVIGVMPVGNYMDTNGDGNDIDDMVAHINRIVDIAGIDHVGLATDGYLNGWPNTSQFYPGVSMNSYNRWKNLIKKLSQETKNGRCRYTSTDLKKIMGWNFLRVYQEVLQGHTKPKINAASKLSNGRFRFSWARSRAIDVPIPKYDVIVYGFDGRRYNIIKRYNNLTSSSKTINERDLYGPGNRPYTKYKWFIKSHNNIGFTNSRWGYFRL